MPLNSSIETGMKISVLNRDVSSLYGGLNLYVCSFAFKYLRVVSYLGLFS
jgi:hypothetical protein